MENKYYTPEIEEFHVGFEYETNYQPMQAVPDYDTWDKKILTKDDSQYFFDLYFNDAVETEFRVKHLDREDIESLGFKKDLGERYRKKVDDKINYNIIEIAPYYTMRKDERENLVRIFFILQNNEYEQFARSEMFRGNIKNKSELKKVLKMIGI